MKKKNALSFAVIGLLLSMNSVKANTPDLENLNNNLFKSANVTYADTTGIRYNKSTKLWEYYNSDNIPDYTFNGISSNGSNEYYVNNGVVTFKHNDLISRDGKWTAIINSKVKNDYTGLSTNKNGVYLAEKGKITFKYNGLYRNNGNVYKIKYSKVDISFNDALMVDGELRKFD